MSGSPLDAMFLTLLELAVGGVAALLLTDWRGDSTPGFLRLCAGLLVPTAAFAWLVPGSRPASTRLLAALVLLAILAYFILLARRDAPWKRRLAGGFAVALGIGLLAFLALTAPTSDQGRLVLGLAIVADTLVLGASGVALVLGHWYLVTPRLTSRPLRRLVDALLIGLALEVVVVALPFLLDASGEAAHAYSDVVAWGRLSALIVLPVILGFATRACCREWPRGRALQAATGLLYVVVGSALGGVMLGNLLRFGPPSLV